MSLVKYIKKRNFNKTTEPKSGKSADKHNLRFVVQRHHASHLHYDFRLEMKGVLKSWAVPKGPSLNPEDKRLAMMVEDHPYDYRTFEGIIPEGNYGAGLVTIFDEGTYEPLEAGGERILLKELHSGNLKFRLHGKILKGEFALVKIKSSEQNAWLLIKHRDEYAVEKEFNSEDLVPKAVKDKGVARKKKAQNDSLKGIISETPEGNITSISYKPMLAKLSEHVFDDEGWIYEIKLDGYRAIAYTGEKVKLISRNGIDFTAKYAPVSKALKNIGIEAVMDGELVIEDKSGKSRFQELQNYDPGNKNTVLKYYVFDLLSLEGHDLRRMELFKRKELLKVFITRLNSPLIIYNEHVKGNGSKLLAKAKKHGYEGIIAKDADSTYESDKRSDRWQKFKVLNSQEAVIIGYTKPEGSRKYFGSLVLGMYENSKLVYIGNCGTGFTESTLKDIYNSLSKLKTDHKPVSEKVNQERNATWVKPELVCEVIYTEWTSDKHLRHPVFKGLRVDKENKNVVMETPAKELPDEMEENFGRKKIKLTNLNKLYWKKEGISKGQLINYYREISDHILPYLKDRPLSLNRHPNGIDAPGFFQKDLDVDKIPSWIKYAPLFSESNNKTIDYLICNDQATLLWMANLGCIEINPWLSTYKNPEHPTFAVMDLDPQDVDFKLVVQVALTVKDILDEMGIKSYIKTSGSRGLHIFIHLSSKYGYDQSRNFIQYLGHLTLERHSDITSLERNPSKRRNKIYLDFLQNSRGQTIAAPYSVRPKPGATVSTPLEWTEVTESLNIKDYTIFNTQERLKEKGDIWKDIFDTKNNIRTALGLIK